MIKLIRLHLLWKFLTLFKLNAAYSPTLLASLQETIYSASFTNPVRKILNPGTQISGEIAFFSFVVLWFRNTFRFLLRNYSFSHYIQWLTAPDRQEEHCERHVEESLTPTISTFLALLLFQTPVFLFETPFFLIKNSRKKHPGYRWGRGGGNRLRMWCGVTLHLIRKWRFLSSKHIQEISFLYCGLTNKYQFVVVAWKK